MQVFVDIPKHTLNLVASSESDKDELIRTNYIIATSKKWYQFWKKSPSIKLVMSGDKKDSLKGVVIYF